jgi:carbon storage regulator
VLILTRKPGQKIIIEGGIEITLNKIKGNQAWIGIDAPKNLSIHREEIQQRIDASKDFNATFPKITTIIQ